MAERILTGRVRYGSEPQAQAQVLAVDERAAAVVADTVSGPDGAWELAAPPEAGLVFARCRGEVIGVACGRADGAALDLDMAGVAPAHELTVRVSGEGLPEWATPQLQLAPMEVGGLGREQLRWVHAPVRELVSRALARVTLESGEARLRVQAGTWWLAAGFHQESSVRAHGMPEPLHFDAVGARHHDGRVLEPVKNGFVLVLDGDATVVVELAPSATE